MTGTYYEQPFLKHFLDAVLLCEMAENLPHLAMSRHSSLARASIMASIFSLEGAANLLMKPVEAPAFLLKLVDRANVLEKYEFILFGVKPDKKLDRGSRCVQEVEELFKIRNDYVHPQGQVRVITHREMDGGTFSIQKEDKGSNHLGLPASSEDWSARHARRVLQATSDFLDYFVLDLCEIEAGLARRLFLSAIEVAGKAGLLLPEEQKRVLRRPVQTYPSAFRLARIIVGEAALPGGTVKLLFTFYWGLGNVERHDESTLVEVEGEDVTSETLASAVQHFLIWFAETHHYPYGRHLTLFEVWSEDKSQRYASFASYLTEMGALSGTGRHHPVGTVAGTNKHLFCNGVLEVRRDGDEVILTALLDSGIAREWRFSVMTAHQFLHSIALSRRQDWIAEPIVESRPTTVETKGRDFEVEEVEFVTFDAMAATTFWTYMAKSGRKVQVNMKPSTLMKINELLLGAIAGA